MFVQGYTRGILASLEATHTKSQVLLPLELPKPDSPFLTAAIGIPIEADKARGQAAREDPRATPTLPLRVIKLLAIPDTDEFRKVRRSWEEILEAECDYWSATLEDCTGKLLPHRLRFALSGDQAQDGDEEVQAKAKRPKLPHPDWAQEGRRKRGDDGPTPCDHVSIEDTAGIRGLLEGRRSVPLSFRYLVRPFVLLPTLLDMLQTHKSWEHRWKDAINAGQLDLNGLDPEIVGFFQQHTLVSDIDGGRDPILVSTWRLPPHLR